MPASTEPRGDDGPGVQGGELPSHTRSPPCAWGGWKPPGCKHPAGAAGLRGAEVASGYGSPPAPSLAHCLSPATQLPGRGGASLEPPSPFSPLPLPLPGTHLLRVAGVDVEVAKLLVIVVLVIQVLQRLPLLVLAELGSDGGVRAQGDRRHGGSRGPGARWQPLPGGTGSGPPAGSAAS